MLNNYVFVLVKKKILKKLMNFVFLELKIGIGVYLKIDLKLCLFGIKCLIMVYWRVIKKLDGFEYIFYVVDFYGKLVYLVVLLF